MGQLEQVSPAVAILLALRSHRARHVLSWIVASMICRLNRIKRRRVADPEQRLDSFLARLAGLRLGPLYGGEVLALLVGSWVMDCPCLAAAIRAAPQEFESPILRCLRLRVDHLVQHPSTVNDPG